MQFNDFFFPKFSVAAKFYFVMKKNILNNFASINNRKVIIMKTKMLNTRATSIQLFPELQEAEDELQIPNQPKIRGIYEFTKYFLDNGAYFSKGNQIKTDIETSGSKTIQYYQLSEMARASIEQKQELLKKELNQQIYKDELINDFYLQKIKQDRVLKKRWPTKQPEQVKLRTKIQFDFPQPLKHFKQFHNSSLINSIVRVFLSLQGLDFRQKIFIDKPNSFNLFHQFNIVKNILSTENLTPISTQRMLSVLHSKGLFKNHYDFLNKFLQKLNTDCKTYIQLSVNKNQMKQSPVQQVFQGLVKKTYRCIKCHYIESNLCYFFTISLDVEKNKSIQSTLHKQFSQKPTLVKCRRCHSKQQSIQTLQSAPKVLILCLHSKPDRLTIQPLDFLQVSVYKCRVGYQLMGLVSDCLNDCYYSIIKQSQKQWYKYSDQKVKSLKKQYMLLNQNKTVFLFYTRKEV